MTSLDSPVPISLPANWETDGEGVLMLNVINARFIVAGANAFLALDVVVVPGDDFDLGNAVFVVPGHDEHSLTEDDAPAVLEADDVTAFKLIGNPYAAA